MQQTLKLHPGISLGYWCNPGGSAEVDFVLQNKSSIVPMEVKAGTNLKSKSLNNYRTKFSQKLAVRASLAHSGNTDGLLSIPLYAVEQLTEYLP